MKNIFKDFDAILSASIIPSTNVKIESGEELEKLLKTDYSEAYQNTKDEIYILRGHKTPNEFATLKTTGLRKSQNTSNIYTTLISEILPSWKNYPKRNACFVCTNDIGKALEYVDNYEKGMSVVLPKNGEKIGICSNRDIWDSFETTLGHYGISNLSHFNKIFVQYLHNLKFLENELESGDEVYNPELINDEIFKLFTDHIDSLGDYLMNSSQFIYDNLDKVRKLLLNKDNDKLKWLKYQSKFILDSFKYIQKYPKEGLIKFLDDLLDPVDNDFILLNSPKEMKKTQSSNEIWFGGTALFINYNLIIKAKGK